jgi:hypothetical protein
VAQVREPSLLARETSLLAPEVAPESTATVGPGPVAQLASFGKQAESVDGTADQSVSTDMKASPSQPATEGREAPEVALESTATVGTGPVAQGEREIPM